MAMLYGGAGMLEIERPVGNIGVGEKADLILFGRNVFEIAPEDIVRQLATMFLRALLGQAKTEIVIAGRPPYGS